MRRFLRGSSSRNPKEDEKNHPKYVVPRVTEVRACEWPSDEFLRAAGLYEDFYYLVENAGLTAFVEDKCPQYLLLTNIFVQSFNFYPRKNPPMVEFMLYDIPQRMTLQDFCNVCKLPYVGDIHDPRPRDLEDFIGTIDVGEERGVSRARIASIHFPVLWYFSLFVGKCLIGRGEAGSLSSPDLAVLREGLYSTKTYSLGAIVAQRLNTNRSKGVVYGGIYATRLARHFEIPIRLREEEEMLLPEKYLDYDSMVRHDFLDRDASRRMIYNLVFSQGTRETITLPAPSLFDLHAGRYTIMPSDIYAYWGLAQPQAPVPEPPVEYQTPVYQWEPEELTQQWHPQSAPEYPGAGYFPPWE